MDYLYDVENRWIGENIFTSSGEHETRFAYDGDQIVLEFDKDVVDGNATVGAADLSHRYVWQPDAVDQLMADEQVSQVVWTLGDNQGTIKDLAVTESGVTSVAAHRVFDSYGNLVSSVNPSTGEVAAVACLFGYTGKAFDNATGLQNNLNRWYDATVGRWLSVDPSGFDGEDANTYRYVGNSPTNAVDASGLAEVDGWNVYFKVNLGHPTVLDWLGGLFGGVSVPGPWGQPGAPRTGGWLKVDGGHMSVNINAHGGDTCNTLPDRSAAGEIYAYAELPANSTYKITYSVILTESNNFGYDSVHATVTDKHTPSNKVEGMVPNGGAITRVTTITTTKAGWYQIVDCSPTVIIPGPPLCILDLRNVDLFGCYHQEYRE